MNASMSWRRSALALLLPLALAACASGGGVQDKQAAVAVTAAQAEAQTETQTPILVQGADHARTSVTPQEAAPAVSHDAPQSPANADSHAVPTQAEQDFAAIYGDQDEAYDPVADASLPTPVELPSSYDPWEPLNRRVHAFNNVVDRRIAKPLAQFYVAVVPRPIRLGVGNFFNNLGQPVSAINALLQGKPKQAGHSLARFAVNTTIGLAGIFDPATHLNIINRGEDFGQTLGVWGWKRSRYVELPLFGPRTVRDVVGLIGDSPLAPLQHVEEDKVRVFLQGLQLVDVRTQLMAVDSMREGATDEYALFRDAWMQRRNYQIFGDSRRNRDQKDDLPDYLKEDIDNPTVPVDVMPMVPGGPAN